MASFGIPPSDTPKSPTGRQSWLGLNPALHLQKKAPAVFWHSVEAVSHWAVSHSFISVDTKILNLESYLLINYLKSC